MAEEKTMRLSLVAKQINVGTSTILQFLSAKGHKVDNNPNAKLNFEQLTLVAKEYGANHILENTEAPKKVEEEVVVVAAPKEEKPEPVVVEVPKPVVAEVPAPAPAPEPVKEVVAEVPVAPKEEPVVEEKQVGLKVVGKIDLDKKGNPVAPKPAAKPAPEAKAPEAVVEAPKVVEEKIIPVAPVVEIDLESLPPEEIELIEARGETLKGLTVLGKIELPVDNNDRGGNKHKRKRIVKEEKKPVANDQSRPAPGAQANNNNNRKDFGKKPLPGAKPGVKEELSDKDIQEQIKATMARLQGATNKQSFGADKRRVKRRERADAEEARQMAEDEEAKVLRVTEFVSASDLASLMDVSVNEVISTCMSLGMFVSINQRLDAEAITIIADEFSYEVQFISAEEEIDAVEIEVEDDPADLLPRAPIVTIMVHVEHCKTSLLYYILNSKVKAV